ncbi:hypothetical protein GDO81_003743 [Engystomops pustulosus]|uniref:Uncharacterized protein n=1 Tax=Engystomops pustulosus TaxID=76066 RepID=A0AAV7A6L0_ENGPU|nr:hypothetical protein GDO81_003743 [Engystomops pustulosus]
MGHVSVTLRCHQSYGVCIGFPDWSYSLNGIVVSCVGEDYRTLLCIHSILFFASFICSINMFMASSMVGKTSITFNFYLDVVVL